LFYTLSDEFKELSGVLIGSPTYRDQLEDLRSEVHSAGFSSNLKILGYQDHETISKHLSESSVFIFPSQYAFEAQPLVLLEALAHSLPIVGYSSGQISEMISSESGSRLVATGDLEQLQVEVKALLSNLDSWTAASELALKAFNKDFSADVYRINWQKAIHEVL
jgi:glycosyltransferase involved in cell wall biosynthesis